jgi:hypothetical protein
MASILLFDDKVEVVGAFVMFIILNNCRVHLA